MAVVAAVETPLFIQLLVFSPIFYFDGLEILRLSLRTCSFSFLHELFCFSSTDNSATKCIVAPIVGSLHAVLKLELV